MDILTQDSQSRYPRSCASGSSTLYRRAGKRCVDLVAACVGISLIWPILILCAVAIKLESPGPVLFPQKRAGRYGKQFTVFKLRTMRNRPEADQLKITVAGDPRVTRTGKWLRKTKLDELPQLFNVLWGDMSLIGPRPEVLDYTRHYDSRQRMVLQVKPGITGLASLAFIHEEELLQKASDPQLFYRTTVLPRKLDLDLEYCETVRFSLDFQIACRTLARIVGLLF